MTATRERTRKLTFIVLKSVSIIVITLGLSSVANAQWVLDHVDGPSDPNNNYAVQKPPWSFTIQAVQPPQNQAGLYWNRNKPDEWNFGLEWADPPASVPDHGVISIPLRITRTRCGANTPPCSPLLGNGFGLSAQSMDSANNWVEDGYLFNGTLKNGSRTQGGEQKVYANSDIRMDETTVYYVFNPFYSNTKNIRFQVYLGSGTTLKTYYYKKGGRQPLQAPILLGPPNGATVSTSNFQLSWRQNGDPGYQETFWLEIWYWDFAANQWKPYWQGYWNSPANFSGRKGTFAWRVFAVDPTHQSNPWYVASGWWKVTSQ